jgi:hypothetical protein
VLLSGVVVVWALVLGLSRGLALIAGAIGLRVLDRVDAALLNRVIGRR